MKAKTNRRITAKPVSVIVNTLVAKYNRRVIKIEEMNADISCLNFNIPPKSKKQNIKRI